MNKLPKRLRRLDTMFSRSCPIFFVTICTAARRPLLASPDTHNLFLGFCEQSPLKASAWVGRYVLMPDHIHVFLSAATSADLSHWVGSLKKSFAAHWRIAGLQPPYWQEGFFDHVLRSNESYEAKWAYVLENPVRAGLVKEPADWPYAGEIHVLKWERM